MFEKQNLENFLSPFDQSKHARLLDVYILSLSQHLETCQSAHESQDSEALKASVHDVKSTAYTMGAQELGQAAETIEVHIIEGREAEAFPQCPDLFEKIAHALTILKEVRAERD